MSGKPRLQRKRILGTRYLPFKCQYVVSSGIRTLDTILQGGLPIGTLTAIEEADDSVSSDEILQYFSAQGILCGNNEFVVSLQWDLPNFDKQLPGTVHPEEATVTRQQEMEIAWRYRTLQTESIPEGVPTGFSHPLVPNTRLPQQLYDNLCLGIWPFGGMPDKKSYTNLVTYIVNFLEGFKKTQQNDAQLNMFRIVVHHLGTPLWEDSKANLPNVIFGLRAIAQEYNAVVMISLPSSVLKDNYDLERCEHHCDIILTLESFKNENATLFKDFSGLLQIKKIPPANSLTCVNVESSEWGFNFLRQRRPAVERLHTPPDMDVSEQEQMDQDE